MKVESVLGGDLVLCAELDAVVVVLCQLGRGQPGDSTNAPPAAGGASLKTLIRGFNITSLQPVIYLALHAGTLRRAHPGLQILGLAPLLVTGPPLLVIVLQIP